MADFLSLSTRSWVRRLRALLAILLLAPSLALAQTNTAQIMGAILPLLLSGNNSTTTLTSTPKPSVSGQSVRLSATVVAVSPVGTVTFRNGSTVLGSASLSGGVAILDTTALPAGAQSLTAVYVGDANNEGSTSAVVTHVVDKVISTVTLAATPSPSQLAQSVTLTANVAGINPTGAVTFKDGTTVLGTASLVNGSASLATSGLGAGERSLRADYAGDATHTIGSATLLQTVKAVAVASLNASPAFAVQGQTVTLALTVTGFNPTGSASFNAGSIGLGTVSLSNGQAVFSTSALTTGVHSLMASYAGDTNNLPASSAVTSVNIVGASSPGWQFGYDALGRLNTLVPPSGKTSYFHYDKLGRQIQSSQPSNTGTASRTLIDFGYDLGDHLTSVTDPRSITTTYKVSGLGTVDRLTSPDSGEANYTYDVKGNVLTRIDARGKQTAYGYDDLGRLKTMTYPTGTATTFAYDACPGSTPCGSTGELTGIGDESGSTTYQHDAFGRVVRKLVTIGTKTFTVEYAWGAEGGAQDKLTSITYPGGSRVNYEYDSFGLPKAVSVNPVNASGNGLNAAPQSLVTDLAYDAESKVIGWKWSDGKPRTIGYDGDGEVASYSLGDPQGTGNAAGALRTVRRLGGRIEGFTHSGTGAAGLDQSFAYDDLDRLTAATINGSSTGYSYDATGNRTARIVGGTPYATTIQPTSNKLATVQDVGGTVAISHDAAGNVDNDGSNTFAYSDRGRMATASPPPPAGTVSYLYNGLGQRARKTGPTGLVSTGTAYYLYDEAGQLLGEYDASGTPMYETIYLRATPVGVMKQTGTAAGGNIAVSLHNAYADHIDTVRMMTKQDHTIVWRWDTAEAFGASAPNQNPSGLGAFVFNQRFPGQVFDAETGLFQNWNREYNARIGRYIQSDPIGLEGGVNTFSYGESDPLSLVDPLGLATHTKGARKSKEETHEKGDERRKRDQGNEKGDERRESKQDRPSDRDRKATARKAACFAAYAQCLRTVASCPILPGKVALGAICTAALLECLSD